MRTAITCLITTAVLLCGTANLAQAEIAWESSLRKAHSRASQENKLILLHFIRDNCVYCDKLEAGAFQAPEVEGAISKNFVPLKINVSDSKGNKKLAEMFKVDRFPMDVVVTTDGAALAHGVSPQQPARYAGMLASTLAPNAPALNRNPAGPGPSAPEQQIAAAPQRSAPQRSTTPTNTVPGYAAAPKAPAAQPATQPAPVAAAPVAATPAPAAAVAATQSRPVAQNKLVSARTNQANAGMTLSMPEQVTDTPPAAVAEKTTGQEPKLAMDGFCAVSVVNEARWIEGRPEFGVVHLGKLYLFANDQAMKTFLADPMPYTPVLNEIDVVRFFEERVIVPGKREWAMQDPSNKRMFFFADKAAMQHFENEYARYVDAAIAVMDKAVKESNPGS
ncbi:Thiol:disulfide interchange protein DsbD [Rubripirellula obstinata]|uniref:Thiol:disulfide interchange protein DsbD n=1 Tax=Rubripirellula obstinata TaxID=406547 RepID=A0A5B1CJC7_9BACT|nr:thioredoxin fold domain-containing protein [Rubripirellula obstinata]KAA1259563.1 Thiol:disulfide interchange protein DsbD [Rubripirellula obstinata]